MFIKKIKVISGMLIIALSPLAHAQVNTSDNFEIRAKIENFCSIQANDVNFGVVALPLTAQSANAQMRILCTNNTPYKIDLAYGQYFLEQSTEFSIKYVNSYGDDGYTGSSYNKYNIYQDKTPIGSISCPVSSYKLNQVHIYNQANKYGIKVSDIYNSPTGWSKDINNICKDSLSLNYAVPTGWAGEHNSKTEQILPGMVKNSEFGTMSGAQKGDKLAYKVTLPDDSSKTWTKGFNSYGSTGIGTEQMITINALIVPDKSSSKYLAQDIYMDNITAEITY